MKVTPLPYQISCVKAPTSDVVKRFYIGTAFNTNQNELVKSKSQAQAPAQSSSKSIIIKLFDKHNKCFALCLYIYI